MYGITEKPAFEIATEKQSERLSGDSGFAGKAMNPGLELLTPEENGFLYTDK